MGLARCLKTYPLWDILAGFNPPRDPVLFFGAAVDRDRRGG
jgi:hypothetical protein